MYNLYDVFYQILSTAAKLFLVKVKNEYAKYTNQHLYLDDGVTLYEKKVLI